MKRKTSGPVALCGMTAALSLLLLLLTIVPVSEMGLPALAGALLMPVVVELGRRYAVAVYGAVSLLALLMVPSWEAKLLYVGFFGYYPILKAVLEHLHSRVTEWALKLLVFNGSVVATYWLLMTFFRLDPTSFTIGGVSMPYVFLSLGNGVFLLYDIGLSRLITSYINVLGPRLRRLFRF